MFRYTGAGNPTRMSPDELTPAEVKSRVWAVIRRQEDLPEINRHAAGLAPRPAARHAKHDPVTGLVVAPSEEAKLPQLEHSVAPQNDPAAVPQQVAGTQPTAPPAPTVAPAVRTGAEGAVGANPCPRSMEMSDTFTCSPLLRAAPVATMGASGSVATAATESVAARPGATMGPEETPEAGTVLRAMADP
ncbi:hypothetical protein BAE44_0004989 [Dichanthelium oligosanthes]|uniref:Uncharacterized protein n=1 Tax=Dichanthelium oligosanthes TaxID=888268 RepID=A0A1E5W9C9_9POAL|nr:hypothetical protein BAE44_0004989 [Dichanthelium oligosanthes]